MRSVNLNLIAEIGVVFVTKFSEPVPVIKFLRNLTVRPPPPRFRHGGSRHVTEPFLAFLRIANTDPVGMFSSAAILRPDNPFRLSFAASMCRSRVRGRPSF